MTVYEKDIIIPGSVGAKIRDVIVRLPNGEETRLTPGTHISKLQTIAGKGRNRKIDEINEIMSLFPESNELLWRKRKGVGYIDYHGESYRVELHWYEEPSVGMTRIKIKPDAAGNWFYEDK